jgi:hypothetical protein
MNPVAHLAEAQPGFKTLQYAFAAHLRDPDHQPAPDDIPERRAAVYRELLYNNIEGFISQGFPVLREITNDDDWHAMVRDFFAHHSAQTPYFKEIPKEFLSYLEHGRGQFSDPPYLLELAHYEWIELDLEISEADPDFDLIDRDGDLLTGRPALTPLLHTLSYDYPVHRIGPAFVPEQPEQCFLAAWRRSDDTISFLELNPVTLLLLQLLEQGWPDSGLALLQHIAAELQHPNPQTVIDGGLQILQDLHSREIILGTHRSPAPNTHS